MAKESENEKQDAYRVLAMQRGATQLLFNYLPGRTVDWEDGLAIVQLAGVRLGAVWDDERAATLLEEVDGLLQAWRARGGRVDPEYPDTRSPSRFSVGPPDAIDAQLLDSAYLCRSCSRLHFLTLKQVSDNPDTALLCRHCKTARLRQFPFVFVHGCGAMIPVSRWVPGMKRQSDGTFTPNRFPIQCKACGQDSDPAIPAMSERVRDMQVVCKRCGSEIQQRLTANCPRCLTRLARLVKEGGGDVETREADSPTAQVAMRVSRYSASETYYAQTLTILRLDRPPLTTGADPMLDPIRGMIPQALRDDASASSDDFMALSRRLREAETSGNRDLIRQIRERIATLAAAQFDTPTPAAPRSVEVDSNVSLDLQKALRECVAVRTTVHSRSAQDIAKEGGGASELLLGRVNEMAKALGFAEVLIVDDLPIFNAAFGYTRRSFEPTYRELSADALATEIRVFPALGDFAARRLGRPDLAGTVPIPARDGEHEGLYLSLDPLRVREWLSRNGVHLEGERPDSFMPELLKALEPIDRYYDDIWDCPTRRLLFGLVHSISHAAMKVAARFAGMQRTSLGEYLFLPLLGTVIYDNATEFQMGGLRTMARDQLASFLTALGEEAGRCLYDPDCLDHRGACHGCIHSPDICCRVFNHGLSRAFLIGGHAPWADLASDERIVGYWETAST